VRFLTFSHKTFEINSTHHFLRSSNYKKNL